MEIERKRREKDELKKMEKEQNLAYERDFLAKVGSLDKKPSTCKNSTAGIGGTMFDDFYAAKKSPGIEKATIRANRAQVISSIIEKDATQRRMREENMIKNQQLSVEKKFMIEDQQKRTKLKIEIETIKNTLAR
jgi:hypothetical protein